MSQRSFAGAESSTDANVGHLLRKDEIVVGVDRRLDVKAHARLRHNVLADVHAADAALAALLPSLNERRFQKLDGSRGSLFASLDAPTLSALPAQRWQWATFKTVTAQPDLRASTTADCHQPAA